VATIQVRVTSTYEAVDELVPMWGQFDEPLDGAVVDERPEGAVVDELPDAAVVADEALDVGVEEVELLVVALATAAPPPMRTPASPRATIECRSRIFIIYHLPSFVWSKPRAGVACRERHSAACPSGEIIRPIR
jgi:hypothetical protein